MIATDEKWQQLDRLAGLGWALFPCHSAAGDACTCGKPRCRAKAKHPMTPHGVKEATTDRARIWSWHQMWPHANWAVATGSSSRVVVIDIDRAKGGFESWQAWEMERRGADFPTTTQVRTGGGGLHLVLSYPANRQVRNRVNWLPGVDVRGDGGYVILPGGLHISGNSYEWANPGVPIAPAPGDLLESISGPSARSSSGGGGSGGGFTASTQELRERGLRHGERDDGFNRLAWRLWRHHWPNEDLVTGIMYEVWTKTDQDDDPMPWAIVKDKIDRARQNIEPELLAERRWLDGLGGDL